MEAVQISQYNAKVVVNALKRLGGHTYVECSDLYYSDIETLLDAVFYAREYGLIEAKNERIGKGTEIWLRVGK